MIYKMILLFADMVRRTHRRRSNIIFLKFYGSGGRGAEAAAAEKAAVAAATKAAPEAAVPVLASPPAPPW